METIGLDIGGANLKAATSAGQTRSRPFALWKNAGRLLDELRSLLDDWRPPDRLALTMTGELCDCFPNRSAGVRFILEAVRRWADGIPVHVWRNDGRFVELATALDDPLPAASANWLALAAFAGRYALSGPAILLDVGSTTTDIVPLMDGRPTPRGRTDYDRLANGELVYTGARRTPVCALLAPGEGMAEFFATTLDVYLIRGDIAENSNDRDTADGRPATREFAIARLARMLGGDADSIDVHAIQTLADAVAERQRRLMVRALTTAIERLPSPLEAVIISGSGSFLATAALREWQRGRETTINIIELDRRLHPEASAAACAVAVATLLDEQIR